MKKKKKSKSPFVGLTEKEVANFEANFYTICMGRDFLHDESNKFAFTEKTARYYKQKARAGLKKILKEGDPTDIAEANEMLCSLKIIPLRIQ